jgi:hypothetical protein
VITRTALTKLVLHSLVGISIQTDKEEQLVEMTIDETLHALGLHVTNTGAIVDVRDRPYAPVTRPEWQPPGGYERPPFKGRGRNRGKR